MSVAIGESELQMDFISEKFWTYLDLVFTLAVFLGTSTTTGAKSLVWAQKLWPRPLRMINI